AAAHEEHADTGRLGEDHRVVARAARQAPRGAAWGLGAALLDRFGDGVLQPRSARHRVHVVRAHALERHAAASRDLLAAREDVALGRFTRRVIAGTDVGAEFHLARDHVAGAIAHL